MESSWKLKDFEKEDFHNVQSLFKLVFKKDYLTEDFWHWRYDQNPFGGGIIKLLTDGQKLIGFYAICASELFIPNYGNMNAMLSLNTMTHPDFEKKGVFPYLAREAYAAAFEKGFGLIYGFPNKNSIQSFQKKLNWITKPVDFSFEYNIEDIRSSQKLPPLGSRVFHSAKVTNFNLKIDELWNRSKSDESYISIPRTSSYLNWRFISNPYSKYHCYLVKTEQDEVTGYFVLKNYANISGHIVDFSCRDKSVANYILNEAIQFCLNKKLSKLSLWNTKVSFNQAFKKIPAKRMDIETYFGYILNPQLEKAFDIKNLEWNLTMGASDVF